MGLAALCSPLRRSTWCTTPLHLDISRYLSSAASLNLNFPAVMQMRKIPGQVVHLSPWRISPHSLSCDLQLVDGGCNFDSARVFGPRVILSTVLTKWDKVWQNPTRILIAWCFKLANSATSCDKIESASLYPSEIWQPWCPNFGNPENQIAYLQVFEHA